MSEMIYPPSVGGAPFIDLRPAHLRPKPKPEPEPAQPVFLREIPYSGKVVDAFGRPKEPQEKAYVVIAKEGILASGLVKDESGTPIDTEDMMFKLGELIPPGILSERKAQK